MTSKPKKTPVFNSDQELASFLQDNLTETLKQAIRVTVNIMVKAEMEQFRKDIHEQLSFNGSYMRNMVSPMGKIADIPVPRFRNQPETPFQLQSTTVFDHEKDRFFQLIAEMHRLGVSQRKVKQLAKNCFGITLSANKVGAVHQELASQESLQINNQALTDEFDHLLLDGVWVKCKSFGLRDNNTAVLLCALGIRPDGTRKIIGFTVAYKEDTDSWTDFVVSLKQRGLLGKQLKLIICDDHAALTAAVDQIYPHTPVQICMTHKMRNVMNHTSYKHRTAVAQDLKGVYSAQTREEGMAYLTMFAKKWYTTEEKAVKSLQFDFERTLTYLDFPKEQWKNIRTSNILERTFRELRRRIKVFDNSFNDEKSLKRYGNSIFDYLNNYYPAALHTKS